MHIKIINLYLLFLIYLAGSFSIRGSILPVDIEAKYILFILLLIGLFIQGSFERKRLTIHLTSFFVIFLIVSFFYLGAISFTMFYTPSPLDSLETIINYLFLGVLIVVTIIIVTNFEARDFFLYTSYFFVLVGLIYAFPIILSMLRGSERGDVLLSGPNVATRILFFSTCASIYLYSTRNKNTYFLTSILFIVSIILLGSRGGFLAALICLSIYLIIKNYKYLNLNFVKINYSKLLLIPIFLVIIYFMSDSINNVFNNRIIGLTFSDNEVYTSGRDILYNAAFTLIKNNPILGYGIDSFTYYTGYVYPHNLLLEMWIEIGIIGLIIFVIYVIYSVLIIFKGHKTLFLIFSLIPLYMIIVQMFSGEFYDFRYYFLWVIPFLLYSKDKMVKTKEKIVVKH